MRLTIEPVTQKGYSTVTVSQNDDDQNINEVIDKVVIPALVAWGFSVETILKGFNEYRR